MNINTFRIGFVLQHDDVAFFKFRTINRTTISLRLARSLDDLVDRPNPIELLKVKLVCGVDDISVIRNFMFYDSEVN